MEPPKLKFSCLLFFSVLITGLRAAQGLSHHRFHSHRSHERYGFRPTTLFVFGDSYADTGNFRKSEANSWKIPYGITFPGKPAGRFSDGRVLTDYIAKFLGLKSPIPYRWIEYGAKAKRLHYGINFAYGGTGVFDTLLAAPNMTTQIGFFEDLLVLNKSLVVYTKPDLDSSLALVTLAGNDYSTYILTGGTVQGLRRFITSVINQLAVNLKRIHQIGVKKVAVTALEPLGCLPRSTVMSSFQQCNATENLAVSFHNLLLQQAVAKLNTESKDSAFVVLDLYNSFTTVLKNKGDVTASLKFETPLKPCCMGISSEYSCGSVNEKGVKMYTVCNNPEAAFFWDGAHPTQAGWRAVYLALQSTLENQI